jgi:histidinol phosphatase-like PHP family hydrolase
MSDVNAIVAGYLRDLAYAQASPPQMWGYKRAAAAIHGLDTPLTTLIETEGRLPRIRGIGPASTRVIQEVLDTGMSATVERAIDASGKRADIDRRRGLRQHFLSRAEVLRVLDDPLLQGPRLADYRGDLQMHSEWSDGQPTVEEIAAACQARGYCYAAVTDHSHGLRIAGGMSMEDAAAQRRAIAALNTVTRDRGDEGDGGDAGDGSRGDGFRLLQGIEANIAPDGTLDLSDEEASAFELVLAAPHSRLRRAEDQTDRMLRAIAHPSVRILAHPRGRITGSRAGVVADWDAVFAAAARHGVAIEIDGDPARQDIDYSLAARAMAAGCLFALDSDAHTTAQLAYAETAIAHARLAGIPAARIVNCWLPEQFFAWLAHRSPSIGMPHAR